MDLDPNKNAGENTIENMMVQLLFKNKPKHPTTEQLRKALEKYLGDSGEAPYVGPSGESSGDMFMFPVSKYRAAFEDKPDGVPVIATFLSSETDSGINVDDMKRRQFWDVPNGNDIINECKNTILVHSMLSRALPYIQQAELLLAQVDAAIDCYPECIGIYAPQSGKIITPEMFNSLKDAGLSERFISLFVNARFFNITDTDEMLVDTLGFGVFGCADVQVHFKNLSPGHVAAYAYNVARYQLENGFSIESGETIDSIDEGGNIQVAPQWTVQYEDSIAEPLRTVLDICCGEYAGGNR